MRLRTFLALFLVLLLGGSAPAMISAMQASPEPSPIATATTAPASPEATAVPTEGPTAPSLGPSPSPAAPGAACVPAGGEWTTYGGNLCNQRYSALDQINTSNVANLKGAWTFETGVQSDATSFESSPIVVDGVMYVTGPQSQVWALDARDGTELWNYDVVSPAVLCDIEQDGTPVKALGQAGKTGWVYLLNRETGEPLLSMEERQVPQDEAQHTSYSFTFDQPGTYDYFCVPHLFMRGKIIVDPNAPPPSASPSPESAP